MPRLIAETAWHHEGDFEFMRELVSEIGESGCADVLKMHVTLDLDEYMSPDHELYPVLDDMLFPEERWEELVGLGRSHGLEIMLLVNDTRAARFASDVVAELVEVHSLCLGDPRLLDAAGSTSGDESEIVLGVGGSTLGEIRWAIDRLDRDRAVLMFGFQNYPTRYERVNFARMRKMMESFPDFRFGYADHCAPDEPNNELVTLLGASLGMDFVEKHVTIRPGEDRLDSEAAISIGDCRKLRDRFDILEACEGDGNVEMSGAESAYARPGRMKKVAILDSSARRGQELRSQMLVFRRSATDTGLTGPEVETLLGSRLARDVHAGHVLVAEDLRDEIP